MNTNARRIGTLHALLAALLLGGLGTSCSYNRRTNPEKEENFDIDYGRTDLQQFANGMVEALEASERLVNYIPVGSRPDSRVKLYLGSIQNEAKEHIDTGGIVDKIQNRLVNGGKFMVLASDAGQIEIGDQSRFQHESGRVDPAEARRLGVQLGAEVVLYGTLHAIGKDRGRSIEAIGSKSEDVYYQLVMKCVDLETAEVLWTHEEEISKFERISLFGKG